MGIGGVIFEVCGKTLPLLDETRRMSKSLCFFVSGFLGKTGTGLSRDVEKEQKKAGHSQQKEEHGPVYCLLNRNQFCR